MRLTLRLINIAIALVTLASGLAVLGSMVLQPGYRAARGDSFLLVLAYVAVQAFVIREFWRDSRWVPWIAVGKAVAAWLFLATFSVAGVFWMRASPGRYVYQLFSWGEGAEIALFAMVWLGRGVWNTLNALYFTTGWWLPLRQRRPLLGRAVTAVAVLLVAVAMWTFFELVRVGLVRDVARSVWANLDCEAIHANAGKVTTDVREPPGGGQRYTVRIEWGCPRTRVLVADEHGRIAPYAGERPDCCGG